MYVAPTLPGIPATVDYDDLNFVTRLPGYDGSFELIHFVQWSDFEEHQWVGILRRSGLLYEIGGGAGGCRPDTKESFSPILISEPDALKLMLEWEEFE
jgi:hypothetical protein